MLFRKKHSKPCGGSKPPPYSIITDISPNRGITPALPAGTRQPYRRERSYRSEIFIKIHGRTQFAPTRVGNDRRRVPQSHIKFTGGRGNPPLQRVVEDADPYTKLKFVILSEAKDLKSVKYRMSGTRFFGCRLRMTKSRAVQIFEQPVVFYTPYFVLFRRFLYGFFGEFVVVTLYRYPFGFLHHNAHGVF